MKGLALKCLVIIVQILFLLPRVSSSQEFIGLWKGKIQADSLLEIKFNVLKQEPSVVWAIMTKPKICAFTDSCFNGKTLQLMAQKEKFALTGKITDNKNQFSGEFTINGKTYPVDLFRGEKPIYRPQEPNEPFPYYSEEVTFRNEKDSVVLSGTVTLPDKEGRFPAVILKGGSSPVSRDGEGTFHKNLLVIADYLTRNGIAVLRYDDRGIGKSTGNFWTSTAVNLSDDMIAGYKYLSSRDDIENNRIGLVGHSEGGMVVSIAAIQCKIIKFVIMLASPGINFRNLSTIQRESKFLLEDFPSSFHDFWLRTDSMIFTLLDRGKNSKEIFEETNSYLNDYFQNLPDSLRKISLLQTYLLINLRKRTSIHYLYLYNVKPTEIYQKLTCPVLSLNGTNDIHVPARINQAAIRQALLVGGNKDFKILEMGGLNHFFQECETGSEKEALAIAQTISPKVLEIITEWILQHSGIE